jgi:patatin-like phospholipase/acyl hydrolase
MYKIILSFALVVSFVSTKDEYFNILSLDGGGIRGLITAQVVEYMEN